MPTPMQYGVAARLALGASLLVAVACFRGFQPKDFHTHVDLFSASLAEFNKRKWENAITGFERLTLDLSVRDTLLPRAHWYLAQAHERRNEHLLAATSFLRLAESFPDDSLADDALLAAGSAYANMWRDPANDATYGELARTQFRLLVSIYPESSLRPEAEKGSKRMDEMFATKEYETGRHYRRRRAFDSALISYKYVVANFPDTQKARDALLRMVEIYRRPEMRYLEEARETCVTLRTAYPGDREVDKACPSAVVADSTKQVKPDTGTAAKPMRAP